MNEQEFELAPAETTSEPVEATEAVPDDLPAGEEENVNDLQSDPLMSVLFFLGGLYFFKLWWEDTRNAEKGNPHPKAFPGTYRCGFPILGIAVVGSVGLVLLSTIGEIALGMSSEQSDTIWLALLGWIGAAIVEELLIRGFGGTMIERGSFQFLLGPLGFKKPPQLPEDEAAAKAEKTPAEVAATGESPETENAETVEAATASDEAVTSAKEPKAPVKPRPPSPATLRELIPGIVFVSILFALAHPFLWSVEFPDKQGVGGLTRYFQGTYSLNLTEPYQWWVTLMVLANSVFWFYVRYSAKNPNHSLLPCVFGHVAANITVFVVKLMQGHVVGVWNVVG